MGAETGSGGYSEVLESSPFTELLKAVAPGVTESRPAVTSAPARGEGPLPTSTGATPDPLWLPPNWDALVKEIPDEVLTDDERQRLALEIDYRLLLRQEAANVVGEAAILAAERFQDEQIAKIVRDLQGNWQQDLAVSLLTVLFLPGLTAGLGAALSVVVFRPLLTSVTATAARRAAQPVAAAAVRSRAGRGRRKGKASPSVPKNRSVSSDFAQALATIGDENALNALKAGDAKEHAKTVLEGLAVMADDLGASSASELATTAGREGATRRRPAAPAGIGSPRTQLLAAMYDLSSRMRLAAGLARYRYQLRIYAGDLAFADAGAMLAGFKVPAQQPWSFGRHRAYLATAFEALIWSYELLPPASPGPALGRGGRPVPAATAFTLPLVADFGDTGVADYLEARFLEAAQDWKSTTRANVPDVQGPDDKWGRQLLVARYLRAMAAAGPGKAKEVVDQASG